MVDAQTGEKEKQRAALLEEAARIVAVASAQGRALTVDEDSHVLRLIEQARALEGKMHRFVMTRR
jgi:hypothetical protein